MIAGILLGSAIVLVILCGVVLAWKDNDLQSRNEEGGLGKHQPYCTHEHRCTNYVDTDVIYRGPRNSIAIYLRETADPLLVFVSIYTTMNRIQVTRSR
jgi:hypothetical protein